MTREKILVRTGCGDFIIQEVNAQQFKHSVFLFYYKKGRRYILVDRNTGLLVCSADSVKELEEKYLNEFESAYFVAINSEAYPRLERRFNELLKEN